jgi:hypothetical protein
MTLRRLLFVLCVVLLFCGYGVAAQKADLKSGPQAGQNLPGPFHPLVVYSEVPNLAGKKNEFVEMYGQDPVVLVFARAMTKPVSKLVNRLDAAAAEHKSARLRVVVVFLSDDDALETNLKEFGEKQALKHVNLAIMEPDGPKHYKLAKEAEVTVVLYKRQKVQVNHAFRRGALREEDLAGILADVTKITARR